MPFYKKHVFFCVNQKAAGKKCCQLGDAEDFCLYTKKRLKVLDSHGQDKVRVSQSGCLGRCKVGPNLLIYPEGVWYTYQNQQDIDEIIERHLLNDQVVERLLQR